MIYILLNIYNFFFMLYTDGSFKISEKQEKRIENNFKSINIYINDMDKFERKNCQRKEDLQKTLGMTGTIG